VSAAAAAGPPWWALLPPAQAQVACGGGSHRLRWDQGRLTAADHPDAEGELVLAALGGDRSACLDLVEAWGRRGEDLQVLAVGPRSAADELTITPDDLDHLGMSGGGWFAYSPLTARRFRPGPSWPWLRRPPLAVSLRIARRRAADRAAMAAARRRAAAAGAGLGMMSTVTGGARVARHARPGPMRRHQQQQARDEADRAAARRAELFSLLALGPEFQRRLSAAVAAAWADGGDRAGDRDAARPALVAALAGRLAPAAQDWLGIDPGLVEVSLHEESGWGRLELSGAGRERRLRAALPAGWLASVWAPGLAVVAGHLVVAVTEAAWPDATVLAVPGPGAEPVILRVRAVDGEWPRAEGAR